MHAKEFYIKKFLINPHYIHSSVNNKSNKNLETVNYKQNDTIINMTN